jgi:hypothetical protein
VRVPRAAVQRSGRYRVEKRKWAALARNVEDDPERNTLSLYSLAALTRRDRAPANILRPALIRNGLDPDNLPERGPLDIVRDITIEAEEQRPKRWKDIWSAGHSASGVKAILSVEQLVAQTLEEYRSL